MRYIGQMNNSTVQRMRFNIKFMLLFIIIMYLRYLSLGRKVRASQKISNIEMATYGMPEDQQTNYTQPNDTIMST